MEKSNKIKHFLNLTNGLEALPALREEISDICFMRVQSCYVERNLYNDILTEIDHNFLMYAAMGYECRFYDFGAKSPTSKAAYFGMKWVEYFISRRWFDIEIRAIIKNKEFTTHMRKFYSDIPKRTKKRYDYYKKYLLCDSLNLQVITDATENDNKPEYFSGLVKNCFE